MTVKITELIERLQEALEDHGDLEVAIVDQPTYPLASGLYGTWVDRDRDDPEVLWIVSGPTIIDGSPYGPRAAFDDKESFR